MHRKLVSMVMLLGLTTTVSAHAEAWSCEYDGSWSTFNSGDKDTFHWSVIWQGEAGGNWKITGDYNDNYGKSALNGNCSKQICNVTQVYQSGTLSGKQYFWKGKYTDQASGNGKTLNRFEGTWGAKPNASDGPWKAVATCTKK